MDLSESALLLLGHGSTVNADSSAPTYQHAEEIRRRRIFGEVQVGFWKEEPNFRQALRQTWLSRVYVVPNFISSGYFTEEVIPRELGLTGAVTRLGAQEVILCPPVGLHPSMTEALLQRARVVVEQSGEAIAQPKETACLFICGHGTSFNDNSTKIIHEQAAIIRERGLFADCQPVLMEQKPFVKDWRQLTKCPDVIVVPFFISDGLHSFEDIPVLLGLNNASQAQVSNPHQEGDRRLWYASAIGTEKSMADVILAQVEQARGLHAEPVPGVSAEPPVMAELKRFLAANAAPWKIGQVVIEANFELRHETDVASAREELQRQSVLEDLRARLWVDAAGRFRPLRAAPNLRPGWIYAAHNVEGLGLALDYLYPAGVANWQLWLGGNLPLTPWRTSAERQTGRFRVVRELEIESLNELVTQTCRAGCLKQRLWSPEREPVIERAGEIPLLCPEACNFLISKARAKLKGGAED